MKRNIKKNGEVKRLCEESKAGFFRPNKTLLLALGRNAAEIFSVILSYCELTYKFECWATEENLGKPYGIKSRTTIGKAIKKLKEHDLIYVDRYLESGIPVYKINERALYKLENEFGEANEVIDVTEEYEYLPDNENAERHQFVQKNQADLASLLRDNSNGLLDYPVAFKKAGEMDYEDAKELLEKGRISIDTV